jgi:hypothetical protein
MIKGKPEVPAQAKKTVNVFAGNEHGLEGHTEFSL